MALYDAAGKLVEPVKPKDAPYDGVLEKPLRITGMKDFKTSLLGIYSKPRLWSAEDPNLYTLILTLKRDGKTEEMVSSRVGFRNVVIKDSVFLVNGQPVKVKGVNRHESHPETGHYVTPEQMEEEVRMMKRANINHVRCSHYPADPYFITSVTSTAFTCRMRPTSSPTAITMARSPFPIPLSGCRPMWTASWRWWSATRTIPA